MANDITANPWKLDTPGTVYTKQVRIMAVEWVLPTSTGDDLVITDEQDHPLITAKAEANLQSQFRQLDGWYSGVKLVTLDSGTVLIHLG